MREVRANCATPVFGAGARPDVAGAGLKISRRLRRTSQHRSQQRLGPPPPRQPRPPTPGLGRRLASRCIASRPGSADQRCQRAAQPMAPLLLMTAAAGVRIYPCLVLEFLVRSLTRSCRLPFPNLNSSSFLFRCNCRPPRRRTAVGRRPSGAHPPRGEALDSRVRSVVGGGRGRGPAAGAPGAAVRRSAVRSSFRGACSYVMDSRAHRAFPALLCPESSSVRVSVCPQV